MSSEIVIYKANDGKTKLQVNLEDETVWLSQDQMAVLFNKAKSTINEQIKNIYLEKELIESDTKRKFGNSEFSKKQFYITYSRISQTVSDKSIDIQLENKLDDIKF